MGLALAVTGVTGFVGQALLPLLLERGHRVAALVRAPSRRAMPEGVRVVIGDLNGREALSDLVHGADAVIHLAGIVSALTRQHYDVANVQGLGLLAEAAVEAGVKRFVNLSSLAAREPLLNDYAASKRAGEGILNQAASTLSVVHLRAGAIYGPGDTATLPLLKGLLSPLAVIPGSGHAWFSMIHVDDVARSIAEAVEAKETGVFDLADGGGGYQWRDVIDVMQRHFGLPRHVVFLPKRMALALGRGGDVVGRLQGKPAMVNSGQLRQLYHADWRVGARAWPVQNPMPLQAGLLATVKWYQERGMLPKTRVPDTRQHSEKTD